MSKKGFTLVELIVVVLILSILMGLVVYAVSGITSRAKFNRTMSLIRNLEAAIQAYYSEFRAYPPDGYDFDVVVDGHKLKGTAALIYFLGWIVADPPGSGNFKKVTLKQEVDMGGGKITYADVHGGKPFYDVNRNDLTKWGEVMDGWGNPLHYDNVEPDKNGKIWFTAQTGGGWHMNPPKYHNDPDPRVAKNKPQGFNPGSYDLWSHGADGHTQSPKVDDDAWRGMGE
ncbi:MAG: type II secretion system GspH family protein [Planctomycetota bacterium]|nr:type II secretion system GspH family protein [Planctomycetota bacterium]